MHIEKDDGSPVDACVGGDVSEPGGDSLAQVGVGLTLIRRIPTCTAHGKGQRPRHVMRCEWKSPREKQPFLLPNRVPFFKGPPDALTPPQSHEVKCGLPCRHALASQSPQPRRTEGLPKMWLVGMVAPWLPSALGWPVNHQTKQRGMWLAEGLTRSCPHPKKMVHPVLARICIDIGSTETLPNDDASGRTDAVHGGLVVDLRDGGDGPLGGLGLTVQNPRHS